MQWLKFIAKLQILPRRRRAVFHAQTLCIDSGFDQILLHRFCLCDILAVSLTARQKKYRIRIFFRILCRTVQPLPECFRHLRPPYLCAEHDHIWKVLLRLLPHSGKDMCPDESDDQNSDRHQNPRRAQQISQHCHVMTRFCDHASRNRQKEGRAHQPYPRKVCSDPCIADNANIIEDTDQPQYEAYCLCAMPNAHCSFSSHLWFSTWFWTKQIFAIRFATCSLTE